MVMLLLDSSMVEGLCMFVYFEEVSNVCVLLIFYPIKQKHITYYQRGFQISERLFEFERNRCLWCHQLFFTILITNRRSHDESVILLNCNNYQVRLPVCRLAHLPPRATTSGPGSSLAPLVSAHLIKWWLILLTWWETRVPPPPQCHVTPALY